jgi:spoIIIJ-associated protein
VPGVEIHGGNKIVESIEVSGKSVDDALLQALVRLRKRRDEVEVTVLQQPARGAFGIGSKDALIRVTVLPSRGGAVITPEMADALLGPDDEELYEELEEGDVEEEVDEEFGEGEGEEFVDEYEREMYPSPLGQFGLDLEKITVAQGEIQEVENPSSDDIAVTVDVLQHILLYINIRATIQVRSQNPLTLNIRGINENLGLLIGRRGETLTALQLLVSLIVSHRTKHRMRIIVDAENYRERREENLRSLALRVAQQVRNYRRSIALEAMPPHERRIVHIALAESKDISTESIGEGDARRVVISLKRPGR